METKDFTAAFLTDKSPEEVFNAVKNFRAWWSEEIEGNTDQLNEEFFYHYKDIHLCKLKPIEMIPGKKLVYQVTDNYFSFINNKTEWIDTKLIFELVKEEDKTKVRFIHEGLVLEYECYDVCEEAWTNYINNSLYRLITTGKGQPNPKEGEGYNSRLAKKWQLQE